MKQSLCVVFALSVSACASSGAQPPAPLADFATGVQPGCAARVVTDGRGRNYVAGYANLEQQTPIDAHTRFAIASMSKQFTALAVVKLVARGDVDLDQPARLYVSDLASAVGDATVRQLLNQTAGVRDHTTLALLLGMERLSDLDRPTALQLLRAQRTTNFAPGARAQYSNGNYFVLSEIVARVSGVPFEAFVQREIFAPLQMNETGFASPTPGREDARGYRPDREHEGQFLAADDAPGVNGSGGIVTSLADLARFEADFRAQARVWTPEIIALMLTPGRLNDGAVATMPEFGTAYGMGLSLVEIRDDVLISHDGGVEGFRAEYVRFARAQDSVVVMCNRADTDAAEIARELLRSAHAGPIEAEAQATSAAPNAAPPPEPASAALLSDIAGVYSAPELGARYEFRPIDGGFDVTITSPLQAAPVEDTWGGMRVTADGDLRTGPIRITPVRAHGVVVGLSLAFGRRVEGLALERVR